MRPNKEYDRLRDQHHRLRRLADKAEKKGDLDMAIKLERAALRVLQQMRSIKE